MNEPSESTRFPALSQHSPEVSAVGAYFLVVNPARRQYLDPGRFGEPQKF